MGIFSKLFGGKKKKENKAVEEKKVEEPKKEATATKPVEVKKKETTASKPVEVKKVEKPAAKPVEKEPVKPVSETKAKEEPEVEYKSDKDNYRNYHVSLRKSDGKWQVKFAKGQKAIKLFATQAEAIDYAKALAKSQEGSITIHMVDGKIRKQNYKK